MTTRKSRAGAHKGSAQKTSKKGGVTANVKLTLGAAPPWTGTPTLLNKGDTAQMPQTPNGWVVFSYMNASTTPNDGSLIVSSGAGFSQQLPVPALTNQPLILLQNFGGNNLNVLNFSSTAVSILIVLVGAGLPGQSCNKTLFSGTTIPLGVFACATGNAPGKSQVAVMLQATSGQLTIFTIQVGNSPPMVIAVNAEQDAGPGSTNPKDSPPAGYYATTSNNTYQSLFKGWGASFVYVANLSPAGNSSGTVTMN